MRKVNQRVDNTRLERIPCADLGNGYFRNPVMVGPGADNTVIRMGADYYMMAGGGWPDQLIWHSRDLVNWEPLVRALQQDNGHAWASDLVHHEGRFFIYTTQVDGSRGGPQSINIPQRSLFGTTDRLANDRAFMNVVLWADDIRGPWSDPINLEVYGLIDPGHIVDEDGVRYLYFNKGMMIRLAPDGLSIDGELQHVYDGWDYPHDWVVEGHCLEAPKLINREGWYFLVSAQGGTSGPSTAHMAVVARSRSVHGPWENSPYNPLVRTWSRDEKWWRQGHGTLIDDADGQWWLLYTGYEKGFVEYGKQSMLLPIEWTDDTWPRVVPGVVPTDILPMPAGESVGHGMPLSDDFTGDELGIQWQYDSSMNAGAVLDLGEGVLTMQADGASALDANRVCVMPVNHAYEATVEVSLSGDAIGGISLTGRGAGGQWVCVGLRQGEVFAESNGLEDHQPWAADRVLVRLRCDCHDVSCSFSGDGVTWRPFVKAFGVAAGQRLGLFGAGSGQVVFSGFSYRGLD